MTRQTLILHIGGGKTGSSFLQYCFASLEDKLRALGVTYPAPANRSLDRARSGHTTSGNAVELAAHLRGTTPWDSVEAAIAAALAADGARHVLYSSEAMQSFDPARLSALRDWASARGANLKVVYYVRSVAGRAYSAYLQRVKKHAETRPFAKWIRGFQYPCGTVVRHLADILDPASFVVRNFDHARDQLYRDFAEAALPPGCSALAVEPKVVNKSLSPFEVELMLELNRLCGEQARWAGQALMSSGNRSARVVVTEAEVAHLERSFQDDVALLNRYLPADRQVAVLGPNDACGDRGASLTEAHRAFAALAADLAKSRARS